MTERVKNATIRPLHSLNLLSHREMESLLATDDKVFRLFRQCALAVLSSGGLEDDATKLLALFNEFDIKVVPESRGLKLTVNHAPASAFVDGRMITGLQDHLFAALRDIVYTEQTLYMEQRLDLATNEGVTDAVFQILRNADVVRANLKPNLVICWGGHSISRYEYDYTKEVGYQLGLRRLSIGTGCGIGAMKGPMKGAAVGHAKQQVPDGRYIGISEPGIIASEAPNAIVNELVILPDIEKRLEAFVRLAHTIIVFPGGAGTAEEVLYLLGILMHPENKDIPFPLIFAAPEGSQDYFTVLEEFIVATLGEDAKNYYEIIIGQPEVVADHAMKGCKNVQRYRRHTEESYAYNWQLKIDWGLQQPFEPNHANMSELNLTKDQPVHDLAANLRRAFSGIVAGNVKAPGIAEINKHGPFKIHGDPDMMQRLDSLLRGFVEQKRMKLGHEEYVPCYEVIT
ncbi:MAG: putative Rossmann-fold nucleotide-binding protein [Patiriisocius sp.]|jgi:predicted Rossmann-fold nucleotide-binding protein